MRFLPRFSWALLASAPLLLAPAAHAQTNPEDELIPDDSVPAQVAPEPLKTAPSITAEPAAPPVDPNANDAAPTIPAQSANSSTVANGANSNADTVTIPRAVWEQLLKDVDELKNSRAANATSGGDSGNETPPSTIDEGALSTGENSKAPATEAPSAASGSKNYLLLPDISFIGQAKGVASTDRRTEERGSLHLTEGELAIQGFVYPNVAANAFIVAAPSEGEAFQIEEGYLNFLGVRKNLNVIVGRKFTPFGRTGEQHNHSWLYARQLIPFRNLVAEEALTGDGVLLRYLLPTGKIFANLDVGAWNGEGPSEISSSTFGTTTPNGTGSGFYDRFYTARLWSGFALSEKSELELGTSYARGRAGVNDDSGANLGVGRNQLNGLDISYRRFGTGNKRLLLRSEYFRSKPSGGLSNALSTASGYYGLANYRFDKYNDVGVLLENSGFPQARGQREKAASLILTRQLTEQFYIRLHMTHGDSPGKGAYNQAILQFVFGLGPHTHNLE